MKEGDKKVGTERQTNIMRNKRCEWHSDQIGYHICDFLLALKKTLLATILTDEVTNCPTVTAADFKSKFVTSSAPVTAARTPVK